MANSGLFPIVENIFSWSFELIFWEIVPLDSQEHNERKIKTSQWKVQIFSPYNVLIIEFPLEEWYRLAKKLK